MLLHYVAELDQNMDVHPLSRLDPKRIFRGDLYFRVRKSQGGFENASLGGKVELPDVA